MTICRKNRPGKDLAELEISVVCSENRQAKRPMCPQQSGEVMWGVRGSEKVLRSLNCRDRKRVV